MPSKIFSISLLWNWNTSPSLRFLFLLPPGSDAESVNIFRDHVEIGAKAQKIFDELQAETETLGRAVASLNTIRRKGKVNVYPLDMEENEDSED